MRRAERTERVGNATVPAGAAVPAIGVAIRTLLSGSLALELDGRLPCQSAATPHS